ncbi:MAG: caspase family protein [Chloroflexota bacterium]
MSNRALLVGINDFLGRPGWRLRGCLNDTWDMQALLHENYGFERDDIRLLHNQEATADGIRTGLAWLLSDYQGDGDDTRIFHFASHGTQVEDVSGDEYDCADEVIVSYDHRFSEPFLDDELNEIFSTIPEHVHFTFIADCCHSGTIQRFVLPSENQSGEAEERVCRNRAVQPPVEMQQRISERITQRDIAFDEFVEEEFDALVKNTPSEQLPEIMRTFREDALAQFKSKFNIASVDRCILLAACEDEQTAADAKIDGQYRGALTWSLTKALRESSGRLNYVELIQLIAIYLSDFEQTPQLECPDSWRYERVFAQKD